MRPYIFAIMMLVASNAGAAEYLGLNLGSANLDAVRARLVEAKATFADDYGYKGYTKDLPSFKVTSYDRFDKFGTVNEAWLGFSPNGILYRISIEYADAGQTFKLLKDALDMKYGGGKREGFGFESRYIYRDGTAEITLGRNTFGFGADQKTTLAYVFTPLVPDVNRMRALIEQDIKKKNAKLAGAGL